ncbi:MAG: hypothetical protein RJA81_1819, partial [Planctomycetota bacterium]
MIQQRFAEVSKSLSARFKQSLMDSREPVAVLVRGDACCLL